eukprot:s25_g23.t1
MRLHHAEKCRSELLALLAATKDGNAFLAFCLLFITEYCTNSNPYWERAACCPLLAANMATVADGYNGTRLPLRETRPGRPQVPSRLPDEHVNRKDNTLNLEHLISEKRSGLDYGATARKADSDKLTTNRLVKDQRIFSNGNSYVGTWLNGRMHGEGHYIWSDGSEYFGEFHEGYMWGNGKKTWPTGRSYDGEWRKISAQRG